MTFPRPTYRAKVWALSCARGVMLIPLLPPRMAALITRHGVTSVCLRLAGGARGRWCPLICRLICPPLQRQWAAPDAGCHLMSDKVLNCLCGVPKKGQGWSEVSFHGCIICGKFVTGVRGEGGRRAVGLFRRRAANGAANLGCVCVLPCVDVDSWLVCASLPGPRYLVCRIR